MSDNTATQWWCVVFEHWAGVYCIGPFPSEDTAATYAKHDHQLPPVWRVAELREPEK